MRRIIFTILIISFVNISFSKIQTIPKSKAEYVISLIHISSTTKIIIAAENFSKAYSNVWLSSVIIKDGYLVFSKGDAIHSWYIENAIFIEKEDDVITIHLNERIGVN